MRFQHKVPSESRPGVEHTVTFDTEKNEARCTCEAWRGGRRPCKHVNATVEMAMAVLNG